MTVVPLATAEQTVSSKNPDDWSPKVPDEPGARLVFYDVGPEHPDGPPALLARLRDTDTSIEVVRRGPLPFGVSTTQDAGSELRMLTGRAHAAMTVRVDRIDARLTPDERWLQSIVTVTVESVLKNASSKQHQDGTTFTFESSGGSMTLDGKTVFARNVWQRLPKVGRTYLMFFVEYKGTLWPEPGLHTFDISDGILKRQGHAPEGPLDLGTTSSDALAIVRAAAANKVEKGGAR